MSWNHKNSKITFIEIWIKLENQLGSMGERYPWIKSHIPYLNFMDEIWIWIVELGTLALDPSMRSWEIWEELGWFGIRMRMVWLWYGLGWLLTILCLKRHSLGVRAGGNDQKVLNEIMQDRIYEIYLWSVDSFMVRRVYL